MKKKYGDSILKQKTQFILSNVPRCLESYKYFYLGFISNSEDIEILASPEDSLDHLNDENDLKLLRSLESILNIYHEEIKNKQIEEEFFQINSSNQIFSKKSESLGFDKETISFAIPMQHSNSLFHAIKIIK